MFILVCSGFVDGRMKFFSFARPHLLGIFFCFCLLIMTSSSSTPAPNRNPFLWTKCLIFFVLECNEVAEKRPEVEQVDLGLYTEGMAKLMKLMIGEISESTIKMIGEIFQNPKDAGGQIWKIFTDLVRIHSKETRTSFSPGSSASSSFLWSSLFAFSSLLS